MTTVIKLKRSTTTSSVPTTGDLEDGEVAVNIADKKIFVRNGASIVEVANAVAGGGESGGGGLEWQSIFVSDGSSELNAVANEGYFVDTTTSAVTVNLPSSPSAGDTVAVIDCAGTAATNNILIDPNGNKIFGSINPKYIQTKDTGIVLVYSDATYGWLVSGAYVEPDAGLVGAPGAPTIGTATLAANQLDAEVAFTAPADDGGNTITGYTATSSPGSVTGTLSQAGSGTITVTGLSLGTTYTFTVTATNAIGTSPSSGASNSITTTSGTFIEATGGTVTTDGDFKIHTFTGSGSFIVTQLGVNACGPINKVSYMVVAGGGGGGRNHGGSGGAGGFREGKVPSDPYSDSPKDAGCGLAVTAGPTTYPISVGGGGSAGSPAAAPSGSGSSFSTISSSGGGGGGGRNGRNAGSSGGSGAGGSHGGGGGSGNSPPVSPPQGNSGHSASGLCGGRGGSASASGGGTSRSALSGVNSSITGSSIGYSSAGGAGGHGQGSSASPNAANRGGSGYGGHAGFGHGGSGSKGVVVIRYKYQ